MAVRAAAGCFAARFVVVFLASLLAATPMLGDAWRFRYVKQVYCGGPPDGALQDSQPHFSRHRCESARRQYIAMIEGFCRQQGCPTSQCGYRVDGCERIVGPVDHPALVVGLMETIEEAARNPVVTGAGRCNLFVALIGEQLDVSYFRDIVYPRKAPNDVGGLDEQRRANEIHGFLMRAVASGPSGWRSVNGADAQDWASRGRFVIAVARSRSEADMGHVAIVVPAEMARGPDDGSGPWVRDSESPSLSRRAGSRFNQTRLVHLLYAVWQP